MNLLSTLIDAMLTGSQVFCRVDETMIKRCWIVPVQLFVARFNISRWEITVQPCDTWTTTDGRVTVNVQSVGREQRSEMSQAREKGN